MSEAAYRDRFSRVLAYVDEHLEEALTVERLSGVAAFSKFHFHRQFGGLLGVGVYEYVRLVRLKRASYDLAFREGRSVIDVALDSGYESPEAFARAFKRRFGQTRHNAAMRAAGVRRLLVVSSALLLSGGGPGVAFFRTLIGGHVRDLERMEESITQSDLEWTIARLPRLVEARDEEYLAEDGALAGGLNLGAAMSWRAVAAFLLHAVERDLFVRCVVGLTRPTALVRHAA